jgi:hypothetical protein
LIFPYFASWVQITALVTVAKKEATAACRLSVFELACLIMLMRCILSREMTRAQTFNNLTKRDALTTIYRPGYPKRAPFFRLAA